MEKVSNIVVYRHNENIIDKENVITLVQQQMAFIGYTHTREQVELELKNSMKEESRSILFVAYREEHVAIGFAYGNVCCGLETKGDYFWLNELYISLDYRNSGIGARMLCFIRKYCKDSGYNYIAMVTHPNNHNAQKFYMKQGFELEELIWVDTYL
jgi:ribosomal protein S18 acetylase RimI-like enzyme